MSPRRRPSSTPSSLTAPITLRPGRRALLGGGLLAGTAFFTGCSSKGTEAGDGKPLVATAAYALSYLVTSVGGDRVTQVDLAKPGVDPHGLELSVAEVAEVSGADLVIAITGFQNALDDALATHGTENALFVEKVTTLLPSDHVHGEDDAEHEEGEQEEGHDHGDTDPHFWHDPILMAEVGEAIGARLAEIDPDNDSAYIEAASELRLNLEKLDGELTELFGAIPGDKPFVTSHTAFEYLAHRYGLTQIGITGIDPEVEPSPRRLLELEEVIDEQGVSTVFFESTASPKVAQTLADKLGIESAALDNLETQVDESVDYRAVMTANAEALAKSWS